MKIIALLFSVLLASQIATAVTPPPVSSKEDVSFVSRKEQQLLSLTTADTFQGYFTRRAQKEKSLRTADLYSLTKIDSLKMDEALCKKALEMIFGPSNEITLKAQDIKIWNSHTGNTCEASMMDPYAEAKYPERRVQIGFINAKPYGVVFKLNQKATAEQQSNMRGFWDSLR